jgi:hypothetical protein
LISGYAIISAFLILRAIGINALAMNKCGGSGTVIVPLSGLLKQAVE